MADKTVELLYSVFLSKFAKVRAGDVFFFHRLEKKGTFDEAVVQVCVQGTAYHCGVFDDPMHVVHALPSVGVVREPFVETIKDLDPDFLEIMSLKVSDEVANDVAQWARQQVGAEYNDIFASNGINSKGKTSFYCSELVERALRLPAVDAQFPPHTLNFCDSTGSLLPYWISYYKNLKLPIPQGDPGSHPSKLRLSESLEMRLSRSLTKSLSLPPNFPHSLHFIDGAAVSLGRDSKFPVFEPRSGNVLTTCANATPSDVDAAVLSAHKAFSSWSAFSWLERSRVLRGAAELITRNIEEIAKWECKDNGKPIYEARADVQSCVETFEFFAGLGTSLAGRFFPLQSRFAYTTREPFGVVAAIGAWNYPFQTASWKIAPALACGNSVVYKPSPLAPVTASILAHILLAAGLPPGTFNVVQGDGRTGEALVEHALVKKVSFTGSVSTGRAILTACARRNVKPVTLELGGKASLVIFSDADLDSAVAGAMMANFFSQGQVCSNASRVLVHRSILDEFTRRLVDATRLLRIGDPFEEETRVGASISREHLVKVKGFIDEAVAAGATVLCGGKEEPPTAFPGGFYLSPCILTNIHKEMRVYKEEIFGTVLLIIPFDDEEEALAVANDTDGGLAAGIFTKDLTRAHRFARQVRAGNVFVNTYNDVSPFVPFGGFDQSGFGRENGDAVLENYTQIKSVFVNAEDKLSNPFQ